MGKTERPDRSGTHRAALDRNRKIIYATQTVCGICGEPVDFSVKYPHPMSPCIDHIVPVAKGGHPSDIDNLQLAHWMCNRRKSDKMPGTRTEPSAAGAEQALGDAAEGLPWSVDWLRYRGA